MATCTSTLKPHSLSKNQSEDQERNLQNERTLYEKRNNRYERETGMEPPDRGQEYIRVHGTINMSFNINQSIKKSIKLSHK